jgi:hypothetical protein
LTVPGGSERLPVSGRSAGQDAELDEVEGEDCLPGPDPGSVAAVDPGAVPAVSAFEVADPALAAGSPLQDLAERWSVLGGLSSLAGFALAGNDDGPNAEVV